MPRTIPELAVLCPLFRPSEAVEVAQVEACPLYAATEAEAAVAELVPWPLPAGGGG